MFGGRIRRWLATDKVISLMEFPIQAAIFLCVVVLSTAIWKLRQPSRYFTIRVQDGEIRSVRGNVSPAVRCLIREVALFNGLRDGELWSIPGTNGMKLEFSKSVPPGARRQLLNSWGAMGWKLAGVAGARR